MMLPVAMNEISNSTMSFTLLMLAVAPVCRPSVLPLHPSWAHFAACRSSELQPDAAAGLPQKGTALRPDMRSEISTSPAGSAEYRELRFSRLPEWVAGLDRSSCLHCLCPGAPNGSH